MEGLVQIQVVHNQQGPGVRLVGLDSQGRTWCGLVLGEIGLTPTVKWTRATEERSS